ncbi:CheR family methyltransferase [Pedobacter psychroterrae]|uniref:Protein-glutamate O-methyltransferase CheR n=1 Tax=Pedobacter psychroterrae TaxID=2530453 RepID=A0A4R0NTZ5_9SPHI|nr:protein-glutamate O-methyltransferase CheR [Pedobacter psychroterrae]TCD03628.1 protein-glutamate O-methyltransferase CheR [Pedobacter psychroterrae]
MNTRTAETITYEELANLVDFIKKIHGFDFGGYSSASLKRRVTRIMQLQKLTLFDLRTLLTNDHDYFEAFLIEVTVNVTEMFRDPKFYKSFSSNVIPYLKSYQRIKVWNAGCSTGEELYSFTILFSEENLYDRTFFYGTDINADVLKYAKNGIYDLQKMRQYSENFHNTGTIHTLSDYYTAKYDAATINHSLKKNVLFSVHNLVSDGVFNEFQVISCRNVLIYFNSELQKKIIDLFYNSLANFGFLCLGSKETLRNTEIGRFKIIDIKNNIYQKIG